MMVPVKLFLVLTATLIHHVTSVSFPKSCIIQCDMNV